MVKLFLTPFKNSSVVAVQPAVTAAALGITRIGFTSPAPLKVTRNLNKIVNHCDKLKWNIFISIYTYIISMYTYIYTHIYIYIYRLCITGAIKSYKKPK
jgi:hypothetical protein